MQQPGRTTYPTLAVDALRPDMHRAGAVDRCSSAVGPAPGGPGSGTATQHHTGWLRCPRSEVATDRQTATPELGSRLLLVLLLVMSPSRPLLGGCAGTYYDPLAASSRASGVRGEPNDKQGHTTCRECLQLQLVGREYLGSQWHCSYVPVPVPVAGPEVGYPRSIEISSPWHGVRCRYQQPAGAGERCRWTCTALQCSPRSRAPSISGGLPGRQRGMPNHYRNGINNGNGLRWKQEEEQEEQEEEDPTYRYRTAIRPSSVVRCKGRHPVRHIVIAMMPSQ